MLKVKNPILISLMSATAIAPKVSQSADNVNLRLSDKLELNSVNQQDKQGNIWRLGQVFSHFLDNTGLADSKKTTTKRAPLGSKPFAHTQEILVDSPTPVNLPANKYNPPVADSYPARVGSTSSLPSNSQINNLITCKEVLFSENNQITKQLLCFNQNTTNIDSPTTNPVSVPLQSTGRSIDNAIERYPSVAPSVQQPAVLRTPNVEPITSEQPKSLAVPQSAPIQRTPSSTSMSEPAAGYTTTTQKITFTSNNSATQVSNVVKRTEAQPSNQAAQQAAQKPQTDPPAIRQALKTFQLSTILSTTKNPSYSTVQTPEPKSVDITIQSPTYQTIDQSNRLQASDNSGSPSLTAQTNRAQSTAGFVGNVAPTAVPIILPNTLNNPAQKTPPNNQKTDTSLPTNPNSSNQTTATQTLTANSKTLRDTTLPALPKVSGKTVISKKTNDQDLFINLNTPQSSGFTTNRPSNTTDLNSTNLLTPSKEDAKEIKETLINFPLSFYLQRSQLSQSQKNNDLKQLKIIVERALERSPDVQGKLNAFYASQKDKAAGFGNYYPKIDFGVNKSKAEFSQNSPTTPKSSVDSIQRSFTITQLLYDGGLTGSEVDRLSAEELVRWYDLKDTVQNIALEALRAYYDVVRFEKLTILAQENYTQHKALYDLIKKRVDAGVGRRVDLDQATGRLALAESNLLTESSNLHDVQARYIRIVGENPPTNTQSVVFLDQNFPRSIGDVISYTLANNPSVKGSMASIMAFEAQTNATDSAFKPKVDLRFKQSEGANLDTAVGRNQDKTLSVNLQWNLFNGFTDKNRSEKAVYQLAQSKDLRDKTCRDIRQSVNIAFNDTFKLKEQLIYLNQQQLSTQAARDSYKKQFDIGQRTLLDLLNSENELFLSKRAFVISDIDLSIAYLRTRALMDDLVESVGLRGISYDAERNLRMSYSNQCSSQNPEVIPINKDFLNQAATRRYKEANDTFDSSPLAPPTQLPPIR